MKPRACGYCTNPSCDRYAQPTFILSPEKARFYDCPRILCGQRGHLERERGWADLGFEFFREVRVEYKFCARRMEYLSLAIIRDLSAGDSGNVYHFRSPVVGSEDRAMKIAQRILANANARDYQHDPTEIPTSNELAVSMDGTRAEFRAGMRAILGRFA